MDRWIVLSLVLAGLLIYAAWIIRCIKNGYEERTQFTEKSGLEVDKAGNLIETTTVKFTNVY